MPEKPQFILEQYRDEHGHDLEKGDFSDVHTEEFQDETKEELGVRKADEKEILEIDEAHRLNELVRKGEISPEYASKHLSAEQTPEETEAIIAKISEKIRDILGPGVVYHRSRKLSGRSLKGVILNGFRSRSQLEEAGSSYEGLHDFTVFPNHVCFTVNLEKSGKFRFNKSFFLDNKFLQYVFNHYLLKAQANQRKGFPGGDQDRDPIRFVGEDPFARGDTDPEFRNSLINIARELGWLASASDGADIDLSEEDFLDIFSGKPGKIDYTRGGFAIPDKKEVIIDPECFEKYLEQTEENPVGGLILDQADPATPVFINYLASIHGAELRNTVPIYNRGGDLIWPRKMSHEEVKAFVAQRDAEKEKGE